MLAGRWPWHSCMTTTSTSEPAATSMLLQLIGSHSTRLDSAERKFHRFPYTAGSLHRH
jgi:hypothetical protein